MYHNKIQEYWYERIGLIQIQLICKHCMNVSAKVEQITMQGSVHTFLFMRYM